MANISQNVNIEMLEKLPDGTYKRKYPKTRSDTGVTFDEHLADNATENELGHIKGKLDVNDNLKAESVALVDTGDNFTSNNVEGAMSELFTNVSSGKDLVGGAITDVDDSVVIPTEPTFNDLSSAIRNISTGKKWASGFTNGPNLKASGLPFKPSVIVAISIYGYSYSTYRGDAFPDKYFNAEGTKDIDGINSYVRIGEFQLVTQYADPHSWIAFE